MSPSSQRTSPASSSPMSGEPKPFCEGRTLRQKANRLNSKSPRQGSRIWFSLQYFLQSHVSPPATQLRLQINGFHSVRHHAIQVCRYTALGNVGFTSTTTGIVHWQTAQLSGQQAGCCPAGTPQPQHRTVTTAQWLPRRMWCQNDVGNAWRIVNLKRNGKATW
jgi:hypothetical protein